MGDADDKIHNLEREIALLRSQLNEKEEILKQLKFNKKNEGRNKYTELNLSADEITRYSRQMLVDSCGILGQSLLKKSSVLIVGAGGLGCPCSLYLAASGIGNMTLVDYDTIELSNLHRQVLYGVDDINVPKVKAAYYRLKNINPNININAEHIHVTSKSIEDLFKKYSFDLVIDGSDNVPTRYLLNDICVLKKVPLISGSALQEEGQLTVYNYDGGPCYRCLFPKPPPPETVTSCGDGGVLGPVPGVIGVLQAAEAIKILTNQKNGHLSGRLLTFDSSDTTFRNYKVRTRQKNCEICGDNPNIKELIDYEQFCGSKSDDKVHNVTLLNDEEFINPEHLLNAENLLLDVRPEIEYKMCHLPESVNIPLSTMSKGDNLKNVKELIEKSERSTVCVICRRGNDSQRAILLLREAFDDDRSVKFLNVRGGLHRYSKVVDGQFPVY